MICIFSLLVQTIWINEELDDNNQIGWTGVAVIKINRKNSKDRREYPNVLLCALLGLLTGLANGLFGSGGGTVAVPAMVHFLKAEEHTAHATAISVILPLAVVSSVFYISKGYADWGLTIKVTLGGLVGGYIGAKLLNKVPDRILRRVFALFMAAAGIKMVL